MKKSIFIVLMTFAMIISILAVPVCAVNDVEEVSQNANDITTEYLASGEIKVSLNKEFNETDTFSFEFTAENEGYYSVGMSYKAIDSAFDDILFSLKVDGEYCDENASKLSLPRMWKDSAARIDALGNQFASQQIPYDDFYFNSVTINDSQRVYDYLVYIGEGTHTAEVSILSGNVCIEYFVFGTEETLKEYSKPENSNEYYNGAPIIIEGESAKIKSNYFLAGKTDASTVDVTPYDAKHNVINYIGGGNWKEEGATLIWETPELESGYYQLGFSYRQNAIIGGKTYRKLMIDGVVPFEEASKIGFVYDDNWQQGFFADENDEPYLVYFSEGKHTISLSVTSGDLLKVREKLSEAVSSLSSLYVDMTMITGENVDIYRDYNLFSQIEDMESRLVDIKDKLNDSAKLLSEITGQENGSHYSVIKNMVRVIEQMLGNKYEAHRHKSYYYTNYCSVSSVLQELRNMPLDLDKISLTQVGAKNCFEKNNFFEQIKFSTERFFVSFVRDYDSVTDSGEGDSITVWVNWGRDQAQVLSSLIDTTFTPNNDVSVNLKLVNASIVQAVLSGNGPDCFLQHARSEPVNLAIRGVLYDLTKFSDCDEVLNRFQKGAELPYRYNGGLYALPDTQNFFMMFYRKDILEQLNLKVPETWEQFKEVSKILLRNNMSVWLPNHSATDAAQVNAGVGSNNIFPSLLLQNNIPLYAEDGKTTDLLSSGSMEIFEDWTDYYTKMKFPVTLDFYNRFRTGTAPLGIFNYNLYTTLKVAAPEIDGLWGFTSIPGTVTDDGTIVNYSSGGGTGCAILNGSKNKDAAWKFIKWWTSKETQLSYSNEVESILGPTGRLTLANVEAIKGLSWDDGMLDELVSAWENVREIPEYPGSYYVSRSIYQSFWNVVNDGQNTKDMMMRYAKEANDEIARKWEQYTDR